MMVKNFILKFNTRHHQLILLIVLLAILLALAGYQISRWQSEPRFQVQPASSSWQKLELNDRQLSLDFPGNPEKSQQKLTLDQTSFDSQVYQTILDNGTLYSLVLVTYPDSLDLTDFDKNAKRMLKALANARENTQITTVKKQTLENNPVLDLTITYQNSNTFNYRFVLAGRNFYILSTSAIPGKTAENEKFFSSLKLITKEG